MLRLPYHNRYSYSPITERKDYAWPDGKRLAVYLGLNIEHFAFGAGDGHLLTVAGTQPDPRTFAWRDYGNRVGVPATVSRWPSPAPKAKCSMFSPR